MGVGSHNSRMSTANNQSVSRFGAPSKFESRLSQNNMSRMSYKGMDNRPSHQKLFGNPNQRKVLPILILQSKLDIWILKFRYWFILVLQVDQNRNFGKLFRFTVYVEKIARNERPRFKFGSKMHFQMPISTNKVDQKYIRREQKLIHLLFERGSWKFNFDPILYVGRRFVGLLYTLRISILIHSRIQSEPISKF